MPDFSMNERAREAFLAETHVAMFAVADGNRGPLVVPVWYWYQPGGDVYMVTSGKSRKTKLLRKAGRASLCVQTETPPYKYVSVEGPITIGPYELERDVRAVAIRYLGPQMGEMYLAATAADHESAVLVRIKPERWHTTDYSNFGQ